MFLLSWIYQLIVRSGILNRFLWRLGPMHFNYTNRTHNGETVTDDGGCTIKVTRWNGRSVTSFGPQMYEKIKDMTIRPDDVIICGFPKTGCHWMHEILHMLVNKKAEVSKDGKLFEGMMEGMPDILLDSVPSPRVLNTHVLYHELPKSVEEQKTKIILTIRCPKDLVVSYFNHTKFFRDLYEYDGTFENYFKMFTRGQIEHGCYFDYYRSWEKVLKSKQNEPHIFFLCFEDLKEDPVQTIKEIADFLGQPVSDEFAESVANVTSFTKLKKKRDGLAVFRKGIVGDWENWLTEEQADEVDTLWREKMDGFHMPPGCKRTYCSGRTGSDR